MLYALAGRYLSYIELLLNVRYGAGSAFSICEAVAYHP